MPPEGEGLGALPRAHVRDVPARELRSRTLAGMRLALALAAPALVACATAPAPTTLDPLRGSALMRDVTVITDPSLAGRAAGSPGELAAAEHVTRELSRAGLRPERQSFASSRGPSLNVHATLEGSRPGAVVVIGAHLDHLGQQGGAIYPGAEDDASGVAVVLGIARALAARQGELSRSVLFVFFGAEESGMEGSAAFLRDPPVSPVRIAAMINVDMIARPLVDIPLLGPMKMSFGLDDRRAVGLVGARAYPALRALVDAACRAEGVEALGPEDLPDRLEREVERQAAGRGDSVAFERAGIPALFFGSGESSDYHQPTDTPDKLSPTVMERRARAILRVALALSRAPDEAFHPATEPAAPRAIKLPRRWYLPVGVSTGLSLHGKVGGYLGGELSLVHLDGQSLFWLGGYTDVLHDFLVDTTRATVGPEIGIGPFGLDGGLLLDLSRTGPRPGFALRPVLSLSWLSLTGRVGYLAAPGGHEVFGEAGLLFKVPVHLGGS